MNTIAVAAHGLDRRWQNVLSAQREALQAHLTRYVDFIASDQHLSAAIADLSGELARVEGLVDGVFKKSDPVLGSDRERAAFGWLLTRAWLQRSGKTGSIGEWASRIAYRGGRAYGLRGHDEMVKYVISTYLVPLQDFLAESLLTTTIAPVLDDANRDVSHDVSELFSATCADVADPAAWVYVSGKHGRVPLTCEQVDRIRRGIEDEYDVFVDCIRLEVRRSR